MLQTSLFLLHIVLQLQWLPLQWCIKFMIAPLTYKVLYTGTPSYLAELLNPYAIARTLRLSSSTNVHVPCTNLSFGSSLFHTVSTMSNSLPSSICSSQTRNYSFHMHIKIHLFQAAVKNPWQLIKLLWFIYNYMHKWLLCYFLLTYLLTCRAEWQISAHNMLSK